MKDQVVGARIRDPGEISGLLVNFGNASNSIGQLPFYGSIILSP